jgi:hypothetical protein
MDLTMSIGKDRVITQKKYQSQNYKLKKKKIEVVVNNDDIKPELIDPVEGAKKMIKESKKTDKPLLPFTLNEKMLRKYTANFKKY